MYFYLKLLQPFVYKPLLVKPTEHTIMRKFRQFLKIQQNKRYIFFTSVQSDEARPVRTSRVKWNMPQSNIIKRR